jgi:hypothetical protein
MCISVVAVLELLPLHKVCNLRINCTEDMVIATHDRLSITTANVSDDWLTLSLYSIMTDDSEMITALMR